MFKFNTIILRNLFDRFNYFKRWIPHVGTYLNGLNTPNSSTMDILGFAGETGWVQRRYTENPGQKSEQAAVN